MIELVEVMLVSVGNLIAFVGIVGATLARSTNLTGSIQLTTSEDFSRLTKVLAWWTNALVTMALCVGIVFLGILLVYHGVVLQVSSAFGSQRVGI